MNVGKRVANATMARDKKAPGLDGEKPRQRTAEKYLLNGVVVNWLDKRQLVYLDVDTILPNIFVNSITMSLSVLWFFFAVGGPDILLVPSGTMSSTSAKPATSGNMERCTTCA